MNFLELSGIAFWVAVFIVFVGYVVSRMYDGLYQFDPAPSVDALIRQADEAKAREVSSRPHVRAGVYQSKGSES